MRAHREIATNGSWAARIRTARVARTCSRLRTRLEIIPLTRCSDPTSSSRISRWRRRSSSPSESASRFAPTRETSSTTRISGLPTLMCRARPPVRSRVLLAARSCARCNSRVQSRSKLSESTGGGQAMVCPPPFHLVLSFNSCQIAISFFASSSLPSCMNVCPSR